VTRNISRNSPKKNDAVSQFGEKVKDFFTRGFGFSRPTNNTKADDVHFKKQDPTIREMEEEGRKILAAAKYYKLEEKLEIEYSEKMKTIANHHNIEIQKLEKIWRTKCDELETNLLQEKIKVEKMWITKCNELEKELEQNKVRLNCFELENETIKNQSDEVKKLWKIKCNKLENELKKNQSKYEELEIKFQKKASQFQNLKTENTNYKFVSDVHSFTDRL